MESRLEIASYLDYAAQGSLRKSFFFLFVWGFMFVFEEMTLPSGQLWRTWTILRELHYSCPTQLYFLSMQSFEGLITHLWVLETNKVVWKHYFHPLATFLS